MNAFLRRVIDFYYFRKKKFFFTTYNDGKSKPEEEIITKDIRNLFRLKKELNYTAVKDIRNLYRLEKDTKAIKDGVLRDNENLFEYEEEENYYKPVTASNFWSNNYIEYKSGSDRKKHYHLKNILVKLDHI